MTLKTFLIPALAMTVSCVGTLRATPLAEDSDVANAYIETYLNVAIDEMDRVGIPTSITLAQGMLESAFGTSELATGANNHFGIKCHKGWTGETYFCKSKEHTETGIARNSHCFRKYSTVEDSYVDHSNFLASRSHYAFLFERANGDYKKWAEGLLSAGYATDPSYADKLIQVIEKYSLQEYDTYTNNVLVSKDFAAQGGAVNINNLKARVDRLESILQEAEIHQKELLERQAEFRDQIVAMQQKQYTTRENFNEKVRVLDQNIARQSEIIGQMQSSLEHVENIQQGILKSDPLAKFFNPDGTPKLEVALFPEKQKNSSGIFYQSGRKATTLEEGESLIDIAERYNTAYKDLLKYNDLEDDEQVLPKGCYIYLEAKASYVKNETEHQVVIGETMHSISQRYGIKLSKLYQRNYMRTGDEPEVGEFVMFNENSDEGQPKLRATATPKGNFGGGGVKRKK
ncbi:MAG: LysM peptidoglycan-binding domain-containing protein [Aureispira sp.]|nr:LysM peptidoglycan-binding domain-containing protein [Aureispira sp.]